MMPRKKQVAVFFFFFLVRLNNFCFVGIGELTADD